MHLFRVERSWAIAARDVVVFAGRVAIAMAMAAVVDDEDHHPDGMSVKVMTKRPTTQQQPAIIRPELISVRNV